jgi:glycosyltransferase involved in cell wall biosynthesis
MKILHCCLAAFYIDDFGYQENILPKMHKLQGHEVRIVSSTETYIEKRQLGYVSPSSYLSADNIPITRLPYSKWLPDAIVKKLRIYSGLTDLLDSFKPEIIFLHDIQFISILEILKYARKNEVLIYADSHTDRINSARNWISLNILHRLVYKLCAKLIEPYARRFYGTLPIRNDFLEEVYGIPGSKIELLTLGVDDTLLNQFDREHVRKRVRERLGLNEKDFVVVSGGKIDRRKNIHLLLEAFNSISNPSIKLVLFGSLTDEIRVQINPLLRQANISFLGWLDTKEVYEVLLASDLGFFPGTHSVLWEQCVGVGIPCVFKKWLGIQHVDVGGNCRFLEEINPVTIKEEIETLASNNVIFEDMKSAALNHGREKFSYYKIAEYAINH